MIVRPDQATLSQSARAAFANAVLRLRTEVPSQMGNRSRYDDYVVVHNNAMNTMMTKDSWAHGASAFLPWHRYFILRFEADLRQLDPAVVLPYWDWTKDQDPSKPTSPFTPEFMGPDGDPTQDGVVTGGPFGTLAGKWYVLSDPDNPYAQLTRTLGTGVKTLPTLTQAWYAMRSTPYDAAPWSGMNVPQGMRARLEGWTAVGTGPDDQPPALHNRVHVWIGGCMDTGMSPNDPIFFLHHANVDRLWEVWKLQNPQQAPYLPTIGAPPGNNLADVMIYHAPNQPAPWPDGPRPEDVIDAQALGYTYDKLTLPTPPDVAVPVPVRSPTRRVSAFSPR